MDRAEIRRCLEQVEAYRASGLKAGQWSQANGVPLRLLASWCAHANRWRAQLEGKEPADRIRGPAAGSVQAPSSFVAASLPTFAVAATVRVCLPGAGGVEVHWPLSHTAELATWLREVAR